MSQLTAPVITAVLSSNGTDINISGISSQNASGYKVRWGTLAGYGREDAITPVDGSYTLDDTFARTTYYVACMAIGDGVDYEDSDWSNEVVVVTEGTEDSSLSAPTFTMSSIGLTWAAVQVGDSFNFFARRYQVSTSESTLGTQQPKCAGGWISTSQFANFFKVCDLLPATTYYVRFCEVRGKRCSAWTTAYTFTTKSFDSTYVITTTAETGTGSITEALQASTNGIVSVTFDPSLDGQTIYITSMWNYNGSKGCLIDASSLPNGITIDGSNMTSGFIRGGYNTTFKNVTFKNITGSTSVLLYGTAIDCTFDSCKITETSGFRGIALYAILHRCVFKDCNVPDGHLSMYTFWGDCVVANNTDSTKSLTVANSSNLVNCYIGGNTNIRRVINNECSFTDCAIVGNTTSLDKSILSGSIARNTLFRDNTCTTTLSYDPEPFFASALLFCRVEGTNIPSRSARLFNGYSSYRCYGCTFRNNTAQQFTGCGGGTFERCAFIGANATTDQMTTYGYIYGTRHNTTLKDCLVYGLATDVTTATNCTITKLSGTPSNLHNCLFGPSSTPSGSADNIKWNESDPSNANYIDKVFTDAANGDWTLKKDSPAINIGDNQYVSTGDLDLAGNARINGTNVDLGAYEYIPERLPAPTFTITPGAGGSGSVAFTLPEGGVSFLLESDRAWQFTNPTEYTGTTSPIAISGLSGTVYFRAKTIGTTSDENSDWTIPTSVFFDVIPPTVTPNINPVTNDTIWRLQPAYYLPNSITIDYLFTISDDTDPSPSYHWYIYDPNNTLIDDGTGNLPNQMLPEGKSCRIQVVVSDSAGNSSSASCTLAATFAKPTFTYTTGPGGTLTINYTLPQGADGADVRYRASGGSWTTQTGVANPCVITGLDGTYDFQLRATKSTDVWVYSGWTTTTTATFDAYAPTLTIPETAVDMTVGASVDLMTGVSATDNQDPRPSISFDYLDAQGQPLDIGVVTQNLSPHLLPAGTYTIVYTASDATGNISTATRALKVRLAAPTYTITTGAGGVATLSYTLPTGAVGCDILPLFSESFNPPQWIEDAPNPCIITGLNGPYVFYFKSVSPGGTYSSNSVRSGVYWLDAVTPAVVVEDKSPIEYVVGDDTVDLLAGVSATDDHDASVPLIYYLTDSNGDIVEVDGVRNNIPSQNIPIGAFKVIYEAVDSAGNKGYNDRGLLVLPTVLDTPAIYVSGLYNTTATISGLTVEHAYGYSLDVDGEVTEIDVPSDGTYAIQNLADNATHLIQAKAMGDWVFPDPPEAPSGHYRDSAWSNVVSVTIGNPSADNAPIISKETVTDRSITLTVANYESSAGYFEIVISEDKSFSNPTILTRIPADEIKISGLKSSTIYWLKLRAVFSESTTPFSNSIVFRTADLGAITPEDKLLYTRERIQMLREYLIQVDNLDSVSIDGITETRIDREKLLRELADLEAEESRLASGGGRLRTMNIRWTI